MSRPQVVVLTGQSGVGKSHVATSLAHHGYSVLDVAEALRDSLPRDEQRSRAFLGEEFIAREGRAAIFSAIRDAVEPGVDTVMDAVRLAETCEAIKGWQPASEVWLVEAERELRMERLRSRLRVTGELAPRALEAYQRFDDELPRLRQLADVVLVNDASLEHLEDQVVRVLAAREH
ncbi:AAA family ATPase [Solirubrobacter phytolaccae]|uniref:AAA family ATPase n=1 Tax=Solirubrobacter phytolaccae TaxID=1404360 RepID=A0A9X3NBY9_9ACTN|nr:AAA family ATPase [Solirubrobacter phytolaccae]MDA0183284.1 AAA family ATPase [Solirubrobacter phytolaccae]